MFRFADTGQDPAPTDGSVLALAVPASCPPPFPFALFFSLVFFVLDALPSFLSLLSLGLRATAAAVEPSSQEAVLGSSNGLVRSVRRMVHLALTVPSHKGYFCHLYGMIPVELHGVPLSVWVRIRFVTDF